MQEESLIKLYWINVLLIDIIKGLIKRLHIGNSILRNSAIRQVVNNLTQLLELLSFVIDDIQAAGLAWNMSYLLELMNQIQEAQSSEDWAFLSDLYEVKLIPALLELQEVLQGMDVTYARSEWFEQSLNVLERTNPKLYHALQTYEEGSSGPYYADTMYEIGISKQGYYTLSVTENDKTRNLCSQYMPMAEAREYVEYVYRPEKEAYLIYGFGMGYHIQALIEKNPDLDIIVYEPDLDILYCALQYSDCKTILEHITLVWDPEWTELGTLLPERELIAWKPEIPHIPIPTVRNQMEMLANRKDSMDAYRELFYLNSRENIRSCTGYIDSIRDKISGKKVVIVAAGPSLDNNLEELRKCPSDTVIIAVGTVYRPMVNKGIIPDYVIVSDGYVSYQILDVPAKVPVLMLATADRKISQKYHGDTYLICQSGYEVTAKYAKDNGYQAYDSGGSVATLALDVAIRMKAKMIAFIGLDLAYYGKRAHASGTGKETYAGYEFENVEGIHGEALNSSRAFTNYRTWMERRITKEDVTMPVVDATEGGAKKKGFLIMTLREYLDKKDL